MMKRTQADDPLKVVAAAAAGLFAEVSLQAYDFIEDIMLRLRSFVWWCNIMLAFALAASGCSTTSGGTAERTVSASGQPLVRLQHDRPEGIDLSRDHDAPLDKVIPLEVDFAMRNKPQFDQLMSAIADPHSPQYHHWLTPEQMHVQFGETQDQFDAVLQWLQEQGFTITDKSYGTNADYIRFKGTIDQVEKAFDVHLVLPEYDHYAAKNDPAVPAKFDGVISRIAGLEEVGPLY